VCYAAIKRTVKSISHAGMAYTLATCQQPAGDGIRWSRSRGLSPVRRGLHGFLGVIRRNFSNQPTSRRRQGDRGHPQDRALQPYHAPAHLARGLHNAVAFQTALNHLGAIWLFVHHNDASLGTSLTSSLLSVAYRRWNQADSCQPPGGRRLIPFTPFSTRPHLALSLSFPEEFLCYLFSTSPHPRPPRQGCSRRLSRTLARGPGLTVRPTSSCASAWQSDPPAPRPKSLL
jgi:hypothetical protein